MGTMMQVQPMPDYLRYPALSSSALTYLAKSPAAYRAYTSGQMFSEGKHFDLGSALHALVEGNGAFESAFVVRPEGIDKRTKVGKEAFAEFEASVGNKVILDRADMERVNGMHSALISTDNEVIQLLLSAKAKREQSVFWNDQGIDCKCRPDLLIDCEGRLNEHLNENWPSLFDNPLGHEVCIDLKTSSMEVSPEQWPWTVKKFGYDLKASHYLAGTSASAFGWLAVESNPPYSVALYWMGVNRTARMKEKRIELLRLLNQCHEYNEWPGYAMSPNQALID